MHELKLNLNNIRNHSAIKNNEILYHSFTLMSYSCVCIWDLRNSERRQKCRMVAWYRSTVHLNRRSDTSSRTSFSSSTEWWRSRSPGTWRVTCLRPLTRRRSCHWCSRPTSCCPWPARSSDRCGTWRSRWLPRPTSWWSSRTSTGVSADPKAQIPGPCRSSGFGSGRTRETVYQ